MDRPQIDGADCPDGRKIQLECRPYAQQYGHRPAQWSRICPHTGVCFLLLKYFLCFCVKFFFCFQRFFQLYSGLMFIHSDSSCTAILPVPATSCHDCLVRYLNAAQDGSQQKKYSLSMQGIHGALMKQISGISHEKITAPSETMISSCSYLLSKNALYARYVS